MLRRLAALLVFAVPAAAAAQATVAVDATADVHAISPLIYGMNYADGPRIDAAHVPLTRWGGNSTSRYNYQIDVSNTGSDYYFENIPGCWGTAGNCSPAPANPQETSGANAYLQAAATDQIVALLTVPTIGWVAKAPPVYGHPFPCGCTGAGQDSYDPWDAPCGDGQIGGAWIDCGPATNTSTNSRRTADFRTMIRK